MRIFKKFLAVVYLAAAVCTLGWFGGMVFTTYSPRLTLLLRHEFAARVAVAVSLGITSFGVLVTVLRALFARAEIKSMRVDGTPEVEVALAAIESCARAAASEEEDVLVDRVLGRLKGSDKARVALTLELIYLGEEDLKSVGARVREHVECACSKMTGTEDVAVRVRFLPTKTKTLTKEVSGERE